jgi:precorrin-6B methylase 2
MLRVSGVHSGSVVLDIGCGDGRVAIEAVRVGGAAQGIGLESLADVFQKALQNARDAGEEVQSRVQLFHEDFKQPNNAVLETCLDRQLWQCGSAL